LIELASVCSTEAVSTVYNLRVADHHTYFVGGTIWGWDVWVHNANYSQNRSYMAADEAVEYGTLSVKSSRAPTHFDGKHGKPSTVLQNEAIVTKLQSRGWTATHSSGIGGMKEEYIAGVGGGKLLHSSPGRNLRGQKKSKGSGLFVLPSGPCGFLMGEKQRCQRRS
jgi:hypothetical protein